MKKKSLVAIGIIAVVALIGAGIFVVTRNNSGDAEPLATVQELPEIQTQEIEAVVEAEPEVEEVEEVEEVKVEAESNGVSEDEEVEADEQESIVAVVENDEEEAEEVDEADKAETTHTQTTETASTTQSTVSNQNVDTAAQAEMLERAAANGFGITNGTDGMTTVEVANDGAGVDMSNWTAPSANWE